MFTKTVNQAFKVEKGTYGTRVVVTGPWSDGISAYIREHGIKELYLNYAWGWRGNNISFLRELTDLEAFYILDWDIPDISPIHSLHGLRFLHVSTYCNTKIEFGQFPVLEECHLEWRRGAESIFDCKTLRSLWLNRYSGRQSEVFGRLRHLKSLSVASAAITEILSLQRITDLEFVGLYHLRNLKSFVGLGGLHHLEALDIEGCTRVGEILPISTLTNLKRLQLTDCGDIESLRPVANLHKLESVVFGSANIVDGDLSPLLGLPNLRHVAFRDRSHYSNPQVEFPNKGIPGRAGLKL